MYTLSYPRLCAIDKSEFEGFASRSHSRKTGNALVTLGVVLGGVLWSNPSRKGTTQTSPGARGALLA